MSEKNREEETLTAPVLDSAFSFLMLHCAYIPSSSGGARYARDREDHCWVGLFQGKSFVETMPVVWHPRAARD